MKNIALIVLVRKAIVNKLLFIVGTSLLSNSAYAEFIYNGQNKLTLEHYSVSGDNTNGLYQFEGLQAYDDLNINFSENYSNYHSIRGYLLVNTNKSDYRGEHGSKINNASMIFENGESNTPYRLEIGDYFASQSRHTLQRGLKGVQIEWQPQTSASPYSLQIFIGRSAQDYNILFDGDKDFFIGGSWLTENKSLGSFALTSVNYHSASVNGNNMENVSSLSWQNEFNSTNFTHIIEAEFAHLSGKNTSSDSLSGNSQFIKFNGYNQSGANYLINLEKNNDQFNPTGAAVTADHETIDLQWGQTISDSMNARIRSQRYQDNISTNNISTSRINGINISGQPFNKRKGLLSKLNFNIDLYKQTDKDINRTFDRDNTSLQLNASIPIHFNLRSRLNYQRFKTDNLVANSSSKRQSISTGLDYRFNMNNWIGNFSPTLQYVEDIDVSNKETSNFSLGWVLSASKHGHRVLFSHLFTDFRAIDPAAIKSTTAQTRLEWQKDWKQHGLSIGLDHFNRAPENNTNTDSYKISIAWSYRFDQSTFSTPFDQSTFSALKPSIQSQKISKFDHLGDLALGARFDTNARQILKTAHYTFTGNSGRYQLFEGKLFVDIENRQLMAIETRTGNIKTASILISINRDPTSSKAIYQRILDKLLNVYGSPSLNIERGSFSTNWLKNLQTNEFSRIVEWTTKSGILRFGIPKPKTGQVRIEMQLRRQHPSADSNDWGLLIVL